MAKASNEKRPCVDCGNLVRMGTNYSGHKRNCALVAKWTRLASGEKRDEKAQADEMARQLRIGAAVLWPTDRTVERVAKAIFVSDWDGTDERWKQSNLREIYIFNSRAAIKALRGGK